MPSGILWGKECVHRRRLRHRPGRLHRGARRRSRRAGSPTARVRVSGNAHVIMPWHVAIDGAASAGSASCRSARRAAASARRTPTRRRGSASAFRTCFDAKILRQKIEVALAEKNLWLERIYGAEPLDLDDVAARYEGYAPRLRPHIADTSLLVDEALARRAGTCSSRARRATLLDLDHGTYPFVTSSNPVAGGRRDGHRHRAEPDRRGRRRREGLRDARRRGPVPDARSRAPTRSACASSAASTAPSPAASAAAAGSTSSRCATPCG